MSEGHVYIIHSSKWDQYYVGSTGNITERLEQHNAGRNKSTRGGEQWTLKYSESFAELSLARSREYEIKAKKSRKHIEWLIEKQDQD